MVTEAKPVADPAAVAPPVAPGGNAPAPAAPTEPQIPAWLSEAIGQDEARQKEFAKVSRSLYDVDFQAHKEASNKRERELTGRVSASEWWKGLDENSREASLDAKNLREEAIEVFADRVPKEILEMFSTAKAVREGARAYIKATSAPTSTKATTAPGGEDLDMRMVERVRALVMKPTTTEAVATGGVPAVVIKVNADNIDSEYLAGRYPEDKYRKFRRTGEIT